MKLVEMDGFENPHAGNKDFFDGSEQEYAYVEQLSAWIKRNAHRTIRATMINGFQMWLGIANVNGGSCSCCGQFSFADIKAYTSFGVDLDVVGEFQGEFRFLSNFWPALVKLDGVEYPSVEHAYQAAKAAKQEAKDYIRSLPTASDAKRVSKTLEIVPDWNEKKLAVMEDLVRQKFSDPSLRTRLLQTEKATLIEGNTWGDMFWGTCRGRGENHLGKILMKVRAEIQGADDGQSPVRDPDPTGA